MKKVPTIFERDWDGDRSRVVDTPNPACDWVFAGEGWPTQKLDGMCAAVINGKLYKRREVRQGKTAPPDFTEVDHDEETGKRVGWVPVGDGPEDKWFRQGFDKPWSFSDGTYELVGPKSQGNIERFEDHDLVRHDDPALLLQNTEVPRDFNGLREWLDGKDIEGIVWHHEDGRMAKIKLRDFGLKREKQAA